MITLVVIHHTSSLELPPTIKDLYVSSNQQTSAGKIHQSDIHLHSQCLDGRVTLIFLCDYYLDITVHRMQHLHPNLFATCSLYTFHVLEG